MRPSPRAAGSDRLALLLYGGFFFVGIVTVLLGPLIPVVKARWGLTDAEVSRLFVAQFVSSSFGSVVATYRPRWSLVAGYGLIAAGPAGLALGGWPAALGSMAMIGLGVGLIAPAANVWVAQRHPHRRGAALSFLNVIWGAGALSCPLIFAALAGRVAIETALGALAVSAAVVCGSIAVSWSEAAEAAASLPAENAAAGGAEPGVQPQSPWRLSLLGGMMFLYVGVETSIGGWLVELSDQAGGRRSIVSLLIGSGFWAALLAGRMSATWILRRVSESWLFQVSLAVAAAGAGLVLVAESRVVIAAGSLIAGAGLASIFPLTLSLLTARTAATRSRGTGWVFAFSGFGAASLPWCTGQVAELSGSLRQAFFVPVAALVVLAVLYGLDRA